MCRKIRKFWKNNVNGYFWGCNRRIGRGCGEGGVLFEFCIIFKMVGFLGLILFVGYIFFCNLFNDINKIKLRWGRRDLF